MHTPMIDTTPDDELARAATPGDELARAARPDDELARAAGPLTGHAPPAHRVSLPFTSLEGQIQKGLNVFLPLKTPAQMPALLTMLASTAKEVHAALASLHYVHFARFVPSPDLSVLWVITSYDGGLDSYIMDFVGVLGDTFTAILQFIANAPPLPVQRYPREFTEFIQAHNLGQFEVWSAYPETTVIDILRSARQR
jgi:hypothetical protein